MYKKLDVPPPVALTQEDFDVLHRIGLTVQSSGVGYKIAFPEGDDGSFEVVSLDLEKNTVTFAVKFHGEPWGVMVWGLRESAQPRTLILTTPLKVIMF